MAGILPAGSWESPRTRFDLDQVLPTVRPVEFGTQKVRPRSRAPCFAAIDPAEDAGCIDDTGGRKQPKGDQNKLEHQRRALPRTAARRVAINFSNRPTNLAAFPRKGQSTILVQGRPQLGRPAAVANRRSVRCAF